MNIGFFRLFFNHIAFENTSIKKTQEHATPSSFKLYAYFIDNLLMYERIERIKI